jgi:phosphoribosylformylglycinamidine synthase
LNFGNPEKPEIMWQFARAVDGISDACRAFDVPITGGNVSFYNETEGRGVFPTPVIGVVGVLEDKTQRVSHHFKGKSDLIYLAGETTDELGGSEYLKIVHQTVQGVPPRLDLEQEKAIQTFTQQAAVKRLLRSAHDVSDGGLAVAIAESLFGPLGERVGATVAIEGAGRVDTLLFSEGQSRMLLSVQASDAESLEKLAESHGVPLSRLGVTGGDALRIQLNGVEALSIGLDELHDTWWSSIERALHI